MSIGVYMKNKTFPFQAKMDDGKISAINFLDMLNCFESLNSIPEDVQTIAHLNDKYFLEKIGFNEFFDIFNTNLSEKLWPLGNFYGGKENLYLTFFVKLLKHLLKSSEFNKAKELLTDELKCIDDTISYKGHDIAELFISVQNSILETGRSDETKMSVLYELVVDNDFQNLSKEDNEKWQYLCCFLFKYIPNDFEQICKIMKNLHTTIDNAKLATCYSFIIHYGMKCSTYSTIHKNSSNPSLVGDIRRYSALFSTAVDLLCFLPVPTDTYTEKASGLVVLALIKTAYNLGAIEREDEFYSKESLSVMSSFGTSYKMNEAFKSKYDNCNKLVQEADDLWRKGDTRHHGAMADYLLQTSKYKAHVSKSLLLQRLKEVAKKYGRVRGVKKQ